MCNPERLAENVLPRYFRHTQYSSWVRTLNHYSFRKTRPGQWVNPHFQRDKPELLHYITRKVRRVGLGVGACTLTSATPDPSVIPSRTPGPYADSTPTPKPKHGSTTTPEHRARRTLTRPEPYPER